MTSAVEKMGEWAHVENMGGWANCCVASLSQPSGVALGSSGIALVDGRVQVPCGGMVGRHNRASVFRGTHIADSSQGVERFRCGIVWIKLCAARKLNLANLAVSQRAAVWIRAINPSNFYMS